MEPETDEKLVTAQKTKNPGRVEWGRKLGAIAKKRKLEKEQKPEKIEVEQSPNIYMKLIPGVGAGIAIFIGIYYVYQRFNIGKPKDVERGINFDDF